MSISTSAKERQFSNFMRKKSRRQTHEVTKSAFESENDDCKRFPYILQKYCEERLYPSFPEVYNYFVRDDGQLILTEHPLTIKRTESPQKLVINAYSNTEMKLKSLVCHSSHPIDTRLFFAFNQAMLPFSNLSSLKLDYCNLTADHILILKEILNNKKTIADLSLIGNPIPEQNFYLLIYCGLKVLILKLCNINEKGLKKIAKEFLNYPKTQSPLIHLDLSYNMVFDEGCKHIATILRCDRTLQSLNLTDCKIRDEGFKTLISCFSKFPLDEEEISLRRKMRFEYYKLQQKATVPGASVGNMDRNANPDVAKDELDFALIEETVKKHPFTNEESFPESREIFCKGNYSLEHLNLAYNHLTKSSLDILLKTLMEQTSVFGIEKGIQRVVLEGNSSNNRECNDVRNTIEDLLASKTMRTKSLSGSVKNRSSLKRRKSGDGSSSATGSLSNKDRDSIAAG